VIDGDGTIYIGSADQYFYSIDRNGHARWKLMVGGIVDSAALLDDQGRVIFGAGDGRLYALERNTGKLEWTFLADPPAVNRAFIRWFEGNVAIGSDGAIYAPNDNFCTYAVARTNGQPLWCSRTWDQTWSSPAFDPASNALLIGNNFPFLRNTFALDAATGKRRWGAQAHGSVVASPLLTTAGSRRMAVAGAFDGFVRAYDPASGRELWQTGLRDHVYASAAEARDGTIIEPGADGTIYALRPDDGGIRWTFDTRAPIRSSPAIDGDGNIYVGSGEGKLFVLNPDGTLRWAMRLIDDPRADLNSSPALGNDAIVIGGENGGVFSIPYDYCLRRSAAADPRCVTRGEALPSDAASFVYTTSFGNQLEKPPQAIEANQPLTFSLNVRRHGTAQLALLDSDSIHVTLDPSVEADADVSGDRRFVTVVPKATFGGAAGSTLAVRLEGRYFTGFERDGGRFVGGAPAGRLDQTFQFQLRPHPASGICRVTIRLDLIRFIISLAWSKVATGAPWAGLSAGAWPTPGIAPRSIRIRAFAFRSKLISTAMRLRCVMKPDSLSSLITFRCRSSSSAWPPASIPTAPRATMPPSTRRPSAGRSTSMVSSYSAWAIAIRVPTCLTS
jgi:outer membrane protein assembly factor BamB